MFVHVDPHKNNTASLSLNKSLPIDVTQLLPQWPSIHLREEPLLAMNYGGALLDQWEDVGWLLLWLHQTILDSGLTWFDLSLSLKCNILREREQDEMFGRGFSRGIKRYKVWWRLFQTRSQVWCSRHLKMTWAGWETESREIFVVILGTPHWKH